MAAVLLTLALPALAPRALGARAARTPSSTATRPATATPSPSATATATATPTQGPTSTPTPTATPLPSPTLALPSLPPIYYQNGATVYAVNPDGSDPTIVQTLAATPTLAPSLLPDGRLIYGLGTTVEVVDRYGRRSTLRTPDLNPGESIWSIVPSPDDRLLAWQLFAPLQLADYSVNTGIARIVLTGRFGDAGDSVLRAQAGDPDGQVPLLLGWRLSSPDGLGGPTLLLQNLYSRNDPQAGVLFNTTRGLLEYDPSIGDLVNDYLPPLASAIPAQRAFAVSDDGVWVVYGSSNTFTPSGEGALAQVIEALNLNTNATVQLDEARNYPKKRRITMTVKRKVGKRTVKRKLTSTLRLYQYFSHHAYVAPGDGRVLYNLLTVSYPPGALAPRVEESVLVATLSGGKPTMVASNAQGVGWLSGHLALIKRSDGLYAVDVVFGGATKLASGGGVQFIGVRR